MTTTRQLNTPETRQPAAHAPEVDMSVVVVSYNVAGLLRECLSSLLTRTPDGIRLEIIVVDNASQDNSPQLVRQNFPGVKLLENRHNFGFPRACNQGWRHSSGRYIFFLNPDATIEPDTLPILIDFMEKHPAAAIVGPRVMYPTGQPQPTRRRFPGRGLAFVESTWLQHRTPLKKWSALKRFYMEEVPDDQSQTVDWLVGAAFVVRREVLDELGGLDERYFMYSEELDLCRRATGQGWQIWYTPATSVIHQEGQSSRQNKAYRYINFQTSKLAYYRKYYGPLYAAILRRFLLATYRLDFFEEWLKLRLKNQPELRRERLTLLRQVLKSGLKPYRSSLPRPATELAVCLLSAEYFPQVGGLGDYTACLTQALREKGLAAVTVLTGAANQPPAPALPGPQKWSWSALAAIEKYLKLRSPGVINLQYQTGAYGMHPAINFLPLYLRVRLGPQRPKFVTTFHDFRLPYLFPKAGPLRRWITRLLLLTSDRAIVTNQLDYDQARAWGCPADRLKLVPIGSNISPVNGSDRSADRRELGLSPTDFAVGYFGLTNRSKGLDTLYEAFARLPKTGWKLVIVGGDTGQTDLTNRRYAAELAELSRRLDLTGRLITTGHLSPEATSRALQALDAVALPFRDGASFRRGSLLAALSHGLPVVTTFPVQPDRPGQPAQLLDDQNVLMIEADDPAKLAAALQELHSDPARRDRLSLAARELGLAFGWDAIAQQLLDVYQSLTQETL